MVMVAVVMLVRAALGIKRRFNRLKPRTKAAQHIFDDMIAPDAQPLADDLDVDVTITDVPGKAREIVGVGGGNFHERFGPADDLDDRAVFEDEAVAVPQRGGLRQIEQKCRAALAMEHDAPAMALMRVEFDRIDGFCTIPMSGGFDLARVLHG